ncbi:sugar phosphate isomerase/epimerase and 4-hydroxyphenylpyruvate domain-containing protein [Micrococcoides hystricis]|uniref:TIM barrel protein n=1 Tax=Micrococcoides hystricis TaxID=1572761 RepID=A0ABV6PDJ0_9MICC
MHTSIATVCISGSLPDKLAAIANAGFTGVEVFEQDLVVSAKRPTEIAALAADLGLSLDLYQPFRDFEGVTEDQLGRNLKRAAATFTTMEQLGVKMMLVCSNVATAQIHDDALIAEQLHRLGEVAADFGIKVAYEALAWGRYVNDYRHAHRLVELTDHPNVGSCLDSFHILSKGADPTAIALMDPQKLFFLQLADAPRLQMDVLSWSRHHRLFPGEGSFALDEFFGRVIQAGYTGPVSLEIFNDVFRQADNERTAAAGYRSLRWLEDQTARWLAAQPDVLAGRERAELHALPEAPTATGIKALQITSAAPERLRPLLTALGVHEPHCPIKVEVNAVTTADPARGVTGFSVASADPGASLLRAQSLGWSQRGGDQDAVLAPDGTAIRFVPEQVGQQAGRQLLNGIDHLNLVQPWDSFDESTLFFEAALGLERGNSTEVPSPFGLVRSTVMSAPGLRLPLNVAPQTLDYPAHVAFGTEDIFAAAKRLADFRLPVPENYYTAIAAQFELPDETVQQLAQHQLLFDLEQTADGPRTFLHFYTVAIDNVFFEVVQRQHGYEGYGAPNAAVRMSAQFG